MSSYAKRVNLSARDRAYRVALEELSDCDDPRLLTIKGHLLMESALNTFVRKQSNLEHPKFFNEAQLSFRQLHFLARAQLKKDRKPWIWELLDKLAYLRNGIAHELRPKNWRVWVAKFVNYAAPHVNFVPRDDDTARNLRMTLLLAFVAIHNALGLD